MLKPLDLRQDAVHLSADLRATILPGFGHDYASYIKAHCTESDPGRLITQSLTSTNWPVWECHPLGEELVLVLSGRARFYQRMPGGLVELEVGPGQAVINPAGVSHTADVIEPFLALYITPGPGTTHEPR